MTSASREEWGRERSELWGSARDEAAERVFERAGARRKKTTWAALLLFTPALAAADGFDTRESSLRETAYQPVYDVTAADLRFSWRADAVGATSTLQLGDTSVTEATASLGAEIAISHEACDLFVAGGQADVRSGETPLSFQQWASFCPLSGDVKLAFANQLAWDVRARLLAPPRLRPGEQRQDTFSFEMTGTRDRVNDPGPLSLVPPPPEYLAFVASKLDLTVGWDAGAPGPLDISVTEALYAANYTRERADNGPPLDLWVLGARATILSYEGGMPDGGGFASAARMDAFRLAGARIAGLRVGADLGLGMGFASDADTPRTSSLLTGTGGVSVERDFLRGKDEIGTLGVTAARDLWPLWDGRVVIDDRATLAYGFRHHALRVRGELAGARTHLLATDGRLTAGNSGGLTTVAEYDVGKHLTLRSRNELGWSVYAPGATADAPRRAVEAMVTAIVHAGSR
jgi:hypothetical protein